MKRLNVLYFSVLQFVSENKKTGSVMKYKKTGSIQVLDPMMNKLVDTAFGIEIMG